MVTLVGPSCFEFREGIDSEADQNQSGFGDSGGWEFYKFCPFPYRFRNLMAHEVNRSAFRLGRDVVVSTT